MRDGFAKTPKNLSPYQYSCSVLQVVFLMALQRAEVAAYLISKVNVAQLDS